MFDLSNIEFYSYHWISANPNAYRVKKKLHCLL